MAKGVTGMDFLIITSYVSERMQNQIKRLEEYGNAVEILRLHRQENSEGNRDDEFDLDAS